MTLDHPMAVPPGTPARVRRATPAPVTEPRPSGSGAARHLRQRPPTHPFSQPATRIHSDSRLPTSDFPAWRKAS
jgi:hypothetical protein